MQLDQSQDFLCWDNTESLTFASTRDSGPVTQRVTTAKVRALNLRELIASAGAYEAGDIKVILPAVLLSIGPPKPADQVILDDSTVLTVLGLMGGKRDAALQPRTWQLVSRNLTVHYQLTDAIDIQRAALTQDVTGANVRHWPDGNVPGVDHGGSTPYAAIRARAQLLSKEEKEERGLRGLQEAYDVIVARQLLITGQDRVKLTLAAGTLYLDIRRLRNPQRMDELPVLECIRTV